MAVSILCLGYLEDDVIKLGQRIPRGCWGVPGWLLVALELIWVGVLNNTELNFSLVQMHVYTQYVLRCFDFWGTETVSHIFPKVSQNAIKPHCITITKIH